MRTPTAASASGSVTFPAQRSRRASGVQGIAAFAALGVATLGALSGCGAGGEPSNPREGGGITGGGSPGQNGTDLFAGLEDCAGISCQLAPAPPGCGDGLRTDDEACDDGNRVSGDGCAANCLVAEPGFSCVAGQPCQPIARCGDGLIAPSEQCDDGNLAAGDGCSERCRIELGSKCQGQPSVCTDAVCGDNAREGAEACDDGNTRPFDGCSPTCLREPNCVGLSCTSECGDGLVIAEDCDDGNLIDGDGCSSACRDRGRSQLLAAVRLRASQWAVCAACARHFQGLRSGPPRLWRQPL